MNPAGREGIYNHKVASEPKPPGNSPALMTTETTTATRGERALIYFRG